MGMDEVNSTPAPKKNHHAKPPALPAKKPHSKLSSGNTTSKSTTSAVPPPASPDSAAAQETMHPARPGAATLFSAFPFYFSSFRPMPFFILHAPPRRKGRPRQYRHRAHSSHRRRGRAACSRRCRARAAAKLRRASISCAERPLLENFAFSANSTMCSGKGAPPFRRSA